MKLWDLMRFGEMFGKSMMKSMFNPQNQLLTGICGQDMDA